MHLGLKLGNKTNKVFIRALLQGVEFDKKTVYTYKNKQIYTVWVQHI